MGVDSFDIRNFVLCNKTMHFPEVLAYIINFVSMVTRWQCFHVVLILIVIHDEFYFSNVCMYIIH
jgi:hypothetical protein